MTTPRKKIRPKTTKHYVHADWERNNYDDAAAYAANEHIKQFLSKLGAVKKTTVSGWLCDWKREMQSDVGK